MITAPQGAILSVQTDPGGNMSGFENKEYNVFEMFNDQWALVTAGSPSHFNTCTIAWGSLGTIWGGPHGGRSIVTVYINPSRYTWEFLKENE